MKNLTDFTKIENIDAYLLLSTTLLAFLISNSPWMQLYKNIFHSPFFIQTNIFKLKVDLLFLINEGLMSIFFLVIGLEIKHELISGSLNTVKKALLPVIAALGGMIIPGVIYFIFNFQDKNSLQGWAIPTATDIAFSIGILSLLKSRISSSLKIFLATLAVVDDLGAIIIIAFFYTAHLSLFFLGSTILCFLLLFICNKNSVENFFLYGFLGILLWLSLLFSGIHPALAGVGLACFIPLQTKNNFYKVKLDKIKNLLQIIVALGVMPLFAFANAGVSLTDISMQTFHFSIALGILLGLFFGKPIGILGASWLATKLKIAHLPSQVRWSDIFGVAMIAGIGFTMSLFIGTLAFGEMDIHHLDSVKIGVFSGSLLSGVIGYLYLFCTKKHH